MFKNNYFSYFVLISIITCVLFSGCKDSRQEKVVSTENEDKEEYAEVVTRSLQDQKYKAAHDLVKKTIAYAVKNGWENTIKAVNENKNKSFWYGDYYVYVVKTNYKNTALVLSHPVNKALRGVDFYYLKDADGKSFVKTLIQTAAEKGKGWIRYKWSQPKTKKVANKVVYLEKNGDYVAVSGVYE